MPKRTKRRKVTHFRAFLLFLVFILFWKGVDGLLNMYLFPHDPLISNIAAIVIAVGIIYYFNILPHELD